MSILDKFAAPDRKVPWGFLLAKVAEVADRLADQASEGLLASKVIAVGTDWTPAFGGWLSASIHNDGDSDVYIRLDETSGPKPWVLGEAPIKKGEPLKLDLRARPHRLRKEGPAGTIDYGSPTIYLICQTGSASVRVFRLM